MTALSSAWRHEAERMKVLAGLVRAAAHAEEKDWKKIIKALE